MGRLQRENQKQEACIDERNGKGSRYTLGLNL